MFVVKKVYQSRKIKWATAIMSDSPVFAWMYINQRIGDPEGYVCFDDEVEQACWSVTSPVAFDGKGFHGVSTSTSESWVSSLSLLLLLLWVRVSAPVWNSLVTSDGSRSMAWNNIIKKLTEITVIVGRRHFHTMTNAVRAINIFDRWDMEIKEPTFLRKITNSFDIKK